MTLEDFIAITKIDQEKGKKGSNSKRFPFPQHTLLQLQEKFGEPEILLKPRRIAIRFQLENGVVIIVAPIPHDNVIGNGEAYAFWKVDSAKKLPLDAMLRLMDDVLKYPPSTRD